MPSRKTDSLLGYRESVFREDLFLYSCLQQPTEVRLQGVRARREECRGRGWLGRRRGWLRLRDRGGGRKRWSAVDEHPGNTAVRIIIILQCCQVFQQIYVLSPFWYLSIKGCKNEQVKQSLGFYTAWFFALFGLQISCAKTQTLPNLFQLASLVEQTGNFHPQNARTSTRPNASATAATRSGLDTASNSWRMSASPKIWCDATLTYKIYFYSIAVF